ncbi:hypothetical protein KFE98_14705 [bacterium SCSIO 12741]|nr:hypothetical protein KFE98_14705 [bacterium SCSIO 12741]
MNGLLSRCSGRILLCFFILFLGLIPEGKAQDQHKLELVIDSLNFNGQIFPKDTLRGQIEPGKIQYLTLLDQDSVAVRIRIKLTRRGQQPKTLKGRFDYFENGKWHKPPLTFSHHGWFGFHLFRYQCWSKTTLGYNAGYPTDTYCSCQEPLLKKDSPDFLFLGQIRVL